MSKTGKPAKDIFAPTATADLDLTRAGSEAELKKLVAEKLA